jgi:hypothetical protein
MFASLTEFFVACSFAARGGGKLQSIFPFFWRLAGWLSLVCLFSSLFPESNQSV